MITAQPVLEVHRVDGFSLWPAAFPDEPYVLLPLGADLSPAEVGAVVACLADAHADPAAGTDAAPGPDPDPDPAGAFLRGLLAVGGDLHLAGGVRITDTATGAVVDPGCCHGLQEWGTWREFAAGSASCSGWFGHSPTPEARLVGDTVRLTADTDSAASPVIELPLPELHRLLDGVAHRLHGFLARVQDWASREAPAHAAPLYAVLAAALVPPAPENTWSASVRRQ
ncbi:hypothetical protein C0216_13755 [Streptomyces globosus]|uniref:Uncharacterized protein n=1 Tax=Streptomyces globosus TaxID=68209 RepID=A0A344U0F5_9ACTN|nr:hypothetical protein [Streptomyces globosus]AXE24376.1 hypothetical protein C0216_13755 [Streptomyces globosus]